jgi:hypothetical protein
MLTLQKLENGMNEQTRMNAVKAYLSVTSQRDLAADILEQAKQDLRRFRSATGAIEREIYRDAHRWIMSDDSSWPLSFLNVCQLLSLSPELVRRDVIGDLSLGPLNYLTRRCGRAARRFQLLFSKAFSNGTQN